MKNRVKRVVAMMLLTIVGASACTQNTPINSSDSGTLDGSYASVDHGEINIWTMPSSANPIQEADCSQYYTDTPILEIETAKNESEAGQIFFHSTGGVQSYTLEICDLSAGNGNIIKKENIKVYNQYYSNITQLSLLTSGRPLGHYPDALIPQRLSEKVGENKVAADYNQSIYIDIFTDEETPAGTYTGDFKLKIDQEIFTVPVSVRVRNFTLTNINHVQSAFFLFDEYIMGGDLDNTPEQYQEYVDFLLDYRVSTTQPVYYSMTDKELWVEQMKDYAANEKVSSYAIGSTYGVEEEMRLLIENSTPEVNLVKKGFRYLIDEPTQDLLPTYEQKQKELIDLLIAIANSYTDEELQTYGVTREDIVGIEVLVTLTISAVGTMDGLRTYCALTSDFHTEERRARYEEYKMTPYLGANNELEGTDYGTTWWYVCCHPYEPAPNYHIDNDVLDARVMSWMQYDYDIDGIVYWGTASYFNTHTQVDEDNGWENVDPYDNPAGVYPGNATNGDGYLVYPGAKYGEPGPLPSSRLINIRDGFEDYEYLLYLENMMDEYVKKYNVADTIDFDAVMSPIYDTLYTGVHADNDFNRVQEARKTVMDMIEWLSSDSHAIMKINDIDVLKNEVTVDVYAMSGATLTVEGKNIVGVPSGEGLKFSYT